MAIREAMTKYGKMIGAPSNNSFVSVFRGIPFAKPPVGERRWKAPEPLDVPSNPEDVPPRLCHSFAKIAVQMPLPTDSGPGKDGHCYPEPMDEDCLYLNIWTPANSSDEKLPVMFWIHGGGYIGGHSYASYVNGDTIAKNGVILVSICYRLDVFGFLAHPELSAESPLGISGNYGTLDQIAALKWVYENISAFGGDPGNITVFGQSAGANSTQVLISSPLSRNMINRAIMESGASMRHTDLIPIRKLSDAEAMGSNILDAMGIGSIDEARKMNAIEFQQKCGKAMFEKLKLGFFEMPFAPVIDGHVLEKSLGEYAASGEIANVECIVGHTDEGGLDFPMPIDAYEPWLESFGDNADRLRDLLDVNSQEDLNKINPNGFKGKLVTASAAFAESRQEHGGKPVYYYYFDRPLPGDDSGAAHTAEIFYVFNCLQMSWRPFTGADYDIALAMSSYFANFAKTGNPNGDGLPTWDAYDEADPKRLVIADDASMQKIEQPAWQRALIDLDK